MTHHAPIVRGPADGDDLWFANSLLTIKASSRETGGAFLLLELRSPRGKTTPLHAHPDEDESFYVLDGELIVHIDGEEHRGGPGAFVSVPRGTPHAFLVTSETAHFLVVMTPGSPNAEAFFREAGDPAAEHAPPPLAPLDIPRLQAAAEHTGSMNLLGPPPFELAAPPVA
ncbi:MAG TPA: quercetin 2,3-dioxygenase [Solirubrobacteraceae bacterium]|nr:quercetin 2,3-dioxygenase [Solirubrobacteraceae bacterium]